MELNEEEQKKLDIFLKEKLTPPPSCFVCGHDDWLVHNRIYQTKEFLRGALMGEKRKIMPFIMLICGYCGHTMFFNAVKAGVLEPQKGKKDAQKED